MSEGYRHIPIQRGKLVERDMFGEVRREATLRREEYTYTPYGPALRWVKNHQPAAPTNPVKPFARELRIALLDQFKLQTSEQFDKVRFYTAVNSVLDDFHGTDAFFEFDSEPKIGLPQGRVTLGVTTRDKTEETLKTDIEIWVPPDGLDEIDKKFDNCIKQVVDAIVAKLRDTSSATQLIDLHKE